MNLLRLLIIAAIVLIGYRLLSSALERRRIERSQEAKRRIRPHEDGAQTVRCAHCGLNLPRSEAIFHDGRPYCSTEHRDQGEG